MRAVCKQWRLLATGFSFLVFGIGAFVLGLVLVTLVSPWPVAERRKNRWTRLAIRSFARLYIRMMWLLGLLTFTFRNNSGFRGRIVVAAVRQEQNQQGRRKEGKRHNEQSRCHGRQFSI